MIEMSEADFSAAINDVLDSLPDEIARTIASSNVVILPVDEPPADRMPKTGTLLGQYVGVPLDQRTMRWFPPPDQILIFRGPHVRGARSREELVENIRVTVLHEIGHLFGLSDARLRELGYG